MDILVIKAKVMSTNCDTYSISVGTVKQNTSHSTHKSICIELANRNEIVNSHPPHCEHYLHRLEKAELASYSEKKGKNPTNDIAKD
ncbi:hypothetical protein llap_6651 [Limosa lapponica baueri]|uniref:Uncharacterized protein n=1 Tax=Limosa lapponica baueri TaxID=1758121 RepID=A0A2I0UAG0_LIMLA|nr:hypothetical protein llap_6651 [Limosa lapponica baueri]